MALQILAKDAGLLFASFIVIVYILDYIFEQKDSVKSKNQSKFIPLLHFIIIILSVCIPKLLWSWQLKRTNAKVLFSKPYNIAEFIQVIKGEDTSYFLLFFIEIALLIFLVVMFSKYGRYKRGKGWFLVGGICVQLAVYVIGLFASYIFKFSNYEAVRLASFERYMNIAYLSGWIVVVLLLLTAFQSMRKYTTFFGGFYKMFIKISCQSTTSMIYFFKSIYSKNLVLNSFRHSVYLQIYAFISTILKQGSSEDSCEGGQIWQKI